VYILWLDYGSATAPSEARGALPGMTKGTGMANRSRAELAQKSSTFLVLELEYAKTSVGPVVQLVASIVGREDTGMFSWDVPRGGVTGPLLNDIAALVTQMVAESVVTMCGVQDVLPME
jgi:hypothetical protein